MIINLLKSLLGTTVLTVAPLETALNVIDTQEKFESPEDSLYTMIKNSSTVSSTKTRWDYDGKQFYSENELNEYIIKNNKIEVMQTSSNPGKIINDYQFRTLDPEKVYDTNFDNYQLVYRDAFGNVSLSKETALDTYTNEGLVKAKYSYDSIKWYDSPEEAKSGFIYKAGLEKSLYYFINGRYYNVFNKKDQEELKKVLTEGYTLKPSKFTNYQTIYGTKESLKDVVRDNFEKIWGSASDTSEELHYTNYLKYEVSHTITLKPGNGNIIKVSINGGSTQKYEGNQTVEIADLRNEYNLDAFKNRNLGWKRDTQCDDAGCSVSKEYYKKSFYNGEDKYDITYLPSSSAAGWQTSDFYWSRLTTSEEHESTLTLYGYSGAELNCWTNIPLNITSFSEIPTQYVKEAYNYWFKDFYDNEFFHLDQGTGENPWNKYNKYEVYQDVLYDVNGQQGHRYSVGKSQQDYQETIKNQLLSKETSTNKKGEVTYKIRDDFYATKEELDNYFYLIGTVDTRLMYTYLAEHNISSIDGLALAATEADAREKQFQYESGVLKKKFFAYDVFGNSKLSAESGEDAIEKLQNMISLSGKYINRKEIETWDGLNYSYDNIIQDGTYNVYRIYSQAKAGHGLNPYLYFDTYDSALEALKAGINKETNVSTTTINIYVYIYTDKIGKNHTYSYSTDEEIKNIVKEVMSLD